MEIRHDYVNVQKCESFRTCEVVEKFLADFRTAPRATRLNILLRWFGIY